MKSSTDPRIAVIGLGYVGLPLAVAFAAKFPTTGYDIKASRVEELREGKDSTLEVPAEELQASSLAVTDELEGIRDSDVYIVTAPTPVNAQKQPDLTPLLGATRSVAEVLKPGDTVIYESTVYPGATEEDCVPLLEEISGLKLNKDFWVGYSPERINPGDKERRVTGIVKITSGSTSEAADFIDDLYGTIITAGTHKAPSIKVAEAAKVIENTQRDVNIALMNELAILFNKLGINTQDVLEAAGTKWNFLKFTPGLVGGHCIGVDPYYLTHKAQSVGYHPEIILAGRRLNDSMSAYVASQLVKEMAKRGIPILGARVLVLGLAFKENTPDLRNTKVVDVIRELQEYGMQVDVHDPCVDSEEARDEYGLELLSEVPVEAYEAVILAVPHRQILEDSALKGVLNGGTESVLFDIKGVLDAGASVKL